MIRALTIVNEGTTSYIHASFSDQNGDTLVPASISYTIHDRDSGAVLLEATSVSPAASVEIRVPPSINSVLDADKPAEIRVATIEAAYGAEGDGVTEEVEWRVKNLRFKS